MEDAKVMAGEYRAWILEQEIAGATVTESEDGIRFETDFAVAEVNFYEFEMLVVELRITNRKNDETAFFLHFELRELPYAKELIVGKQNGE